MAKNAGEYDEMRIKLRLIELRDTQQTVILNGKRFTINSVKMEKEFLPLPKGTNFRTMPNEKIEALAKKVGASKAPARAKADVYINGEGYSIKSLRSAAPAIVNHTPRSGWYDVSSRIKLSMTDLDKMVQNYFTLRQKGKLKEDVCNDEQQSPFATHK